LIPSVIKKLGPNGSIANLLGLIPAAGGAAWSWIVPFLALALLAYLAFNYISKPAAKGPEPVATQEAAKPKVATIDSKLNLAFKDGKLNFSGLVPDEKSKTQILDIFKGVFGAGNFIGNISVDPNASNPSWVAKLGDFLKGFKLPNAAELLFQADNIKVGGAIDAKTKDSILAKLKEFFGTGFDFGLIGVVNAAEEVKESAEKAKQALDGLGANASADDLVKALNLQIINFASGSSQLPNENKAILDKAVSFVQKLPAEVKIEVGGHTDSTGSVAGNNALSLSRANAVKAYLVSKGVKAEVLTTKGYGSTVAKADNKTEEGKFANRRIEYKVTK
jgi:outer membrane protein OmpA-like peptidoglycan-associated protein